MKTKHLLLAWVACATATLALGEDQIVAGPKGGRLLAVAVIDATEDAASIVTEKTLWTHQVAMFGTLLFNHAKAGTYLDTLHGIDT